MSGIIEKNPLKFLKPCSKVCKMVTCNVKYTSKSYKKHAKTLIWSFYLLLYHLQYINRVISNIIRQGTQRK